MTASRSIPAFLETKSGCFIPNDGKVVPVQVRRKKVNLSDQAVENRFDLARALERVDPDAIEDVGDE